MNEVFVVSALRTPIGKYAGALSTVRPDDLAACVIRDAVERSGIPVDVIDDVFLGAANQAGEDNRNVARMAALLAGLPVEVPGVTVNRLCGSGLQAIVSAAREIQVGAADVMVAGGVESMSRAPLVMQKPEQAYQRGEQTMYDTTLGWRMINPRLDEQYPAISLGQTAENVAREYAISRGDQDAWALRSHRNAVQAADEGRFKEEISVVHVEDKRTGIRVVDRDEGPRLDTSAEKLASLRPAFAEGGSVTAGNSSQLNDGASALVLASRAAVDRYGVRPIARFVDAASAGVDPAVMGIGPVPATQKLLRRQGLGVEALEVIEMNEAFASQVLACIQLLNLDPNLVNPNGGAIALGHPLGASGARLATTLVHEMQRGKKHVGLATMCIGVGQGISALFEAIDK